MPMACQSKRLAKCWATRSYPPRKSTPASSTKPSAARWTNSPKPSAAQALASTAEKARQEKLLPQRAHCPQLTPTINTQQEPNKMGSCCYLYSNSLPESDIFLNKFKERNISNSIYSTSNLTNAFK